MNNCELSPRIKELSPEEDVLGEPDDDDDEVDDFLPADLWFLTTFPAL